MWSTRVPLVSFWILEMVITETGGEKRKYDRKEGGHVDHGLRRNFKFCNCPFDCLTKSGISHHNIVLTAHDLRQLLPDSRGERDRALEKKCYSFLTGEDIEMYPDLMAIKNGDQEELANSFNIKNSNQVLESSYVEDITISTLFVIFLVICIILLMRMRPLCQTVGTISRAANFERCDQQVHILSAQNLVTTRSRSNSINPQQIVIQLPKLDKQFENRFLGQSRSTIEEPSSGYEETCGDTLSTQTGCNSMSCEEISYVAQCKCGSVRDIGVLVHKSPI